MNIVHIPDDIKQEFKINPDGSTSVGIRGAARIIGISQPALTKVFKSAGDNLKPSKLAIKLIKSGFESDNLISFAQSGIPDTVLFLVLEYYAYEAGRYRTEQALSVCRVLGTIGLRTWIKTELGVPASQVESTTKRKTIYDLNILELELLQLHEQFGCLSHSQPETLLKGIDRVFWDMPKVVIEHLIALHKHEIMQRSIESRLLLNRKIRLSSGAISPSEERDWAFVVNDIDFDMSDWLKKKAKEDRIELENEISRECWAATNREYLEAATKFQQQIDRQLLTANEQKQIG